MVSEISEKMATRVFYAHGEFCATHPWEVIVATLTLTVCLLTVDQNLQVPSVMKTTNYCEGCFVEVSILNVN